MLRSRIPSPKPCRLKRFDSLCQVWLRPSRFAKSLRVRPLHERSLVGIDREDGEPASLQRDCSEEIGQKYTASLDTPPLAPGEAPVQGGGLLTIIEKKPGAYRIGGY